MKTNKRTERLSLLIVVTIILAVFLTGCIGQEKGKQLELSWVVKPGLLSTHYNYSQGVLTDCTVYKYFEVTGGSGEVEITAELINEGKINTFLVEEGESYKLSIVVRVTPDPVPIGVEDEYDLTISSPSAASPAKVSIRGHILGLSLGEISLQPWEYSPPD